MSTFLRNVFCIMLGQDWKVNDGYQKEGYSLCDRRIVQKWVLNIECVQSQCLENMCSSQRCDLKKNKVCLCVIVLSHRHTQLDFAQMVRGSWLSSQLPTRSQWQKALLMPVSLYVRSQDSLKKNLKHLTRVLKLKKEVRSKGSRLAAKGFTQCLCGDVRPAAPPNFGGDICLSAK